MTSLPGSRLPMLLPKAKRNTHLLIDRLHRESFNVGVSQTLALIRQRYWIPQGRSAVKSVLQRCPVCIHYERGAYKMPNMSLLPAKRVSQSTPFSHCCVDYVLYNSAHHISFPLGSLGPLWNL